VDELIKIALAVFITALLAGAVGALISRILEGRK